MLVLNSLLTVFKFASVVDAENADVPADKHYARMDARRNIYFRESSFPYPFLNNCTSTNAKNSCIEVKSTPSSNTEEPEKMTCKCKQCFLEARSGFSLPGISVFVVNSSS